MPVWCEKKEANKGIENIGLDPLAFYLSDMKPENNNNKKFFDLHNSKSPPQLKVNDDLN